MFSYTINNPNQIVIKKDEFVAIPFGHRCTSALACKYSNIRNFSLPFDWTIPLFPKKIQKVLENNFENFIPEVHKKKFRNKYDIGLAHFNENVDEGIEEYKRRIVRFNNIINQPKKIYFVYINEDYFYNADYQKESFNDNIFNEMLELENFLKRKYININYNILYFDFKHHTIPKNSNIINIVLHNKDFGEKYIREFRAFCGKILSELFNTNLSLGYDVSIFNN
jgi:hypothetical protein